jgi:HEAT repeat protein
LVRLASDQEAQVRASALEAIAAKATGSHEPLFLQALDDPDAWVRHSAAMALERSPSFQAISALIAHAEDPDPFARREIVRVLGIVGGHRALPALLERLVEADPSIRAEAARSLKRIGPRVLPALDALLSSRTLSEPITEDVYELSVVLDGRVNRNDNRELTAIAKEYSLSGQWRKAVKLYKYALRRVETPRQQAKLHAAVGEAFISLGDVKAAREAYSRSLELDPQNAQALKAIQAIETARRPVQ